MSLLEQPSFSSPHHLVDFDGQTGRVMHSVGDQEKDLLVQFFVQPVLMEFLSQQVGHPIYQDRIFTRIAAPGNTKTVWVHETKGIRYETNVDPETGEYFTNWEQMEICDNGDQTEPTKYPKAWARFMKKGAQTETGWPIEEWGAINRSMAETLKMMNIPTVEALSALSDARAADIMGGRKFRDLAIAALDEQKANAIVSREQHRAEKAEEKAAMFEAKYNELSAIVNQLQARISQMAGGEIAMPLPAITPSSGSSPGMKSASAKQSQRTKERIERVTQRKESEEAA